MYSIGSSLNLGCKNDGIGSYGGHAGHANVKVRELTIREFCKAVEENSVNFLQNSSMAELNGDEAAAICSQNAFSNPLSVQTVLRKNPHIHAAFQQLISNIEFFDESSAAKERCAQMRLLLDGKAGFQGRPAEISFGGGFNKINEGYNARKTSVKSSCVEKIDAEELEAENQYVQEQFNGWLERNSRANGHFGFQCAQYLERLGAVKYCSALSNLLAAKKISESQVIQIFQMQLTIEEGTAAGSLYCLLSSQLDGAGMQAIDDLFSNLSDEAVESLLCNSASSDESVLVNLVASGNVEGVKLFSRLMDRIGPRLDFKAVEEMLMNDKAVLVFAFAHGLGSMLEVLSKMYANLKVFKGIADTLASSSKIAFEINRKNKKALESYCTAVQSIHPMLGKAEKKQILAAMRNAEFNFFRLKTKEFQAMCDESSGFYEMYKNTKNILKC